MFFSSSILRRLLAVFSLLFVVTACGEDPNEAFSDGTRLIKEGKRVEGLAKLEFALKEGEGTIPGAALSMVKSSFNETKDGDGYLKWAKRMSEESGNYLVMADIAQLYMQDWANLKLSLPEKERQATAAVWLDKAVAAAPDDQKNGRVIAAALKQKEKHIRMAAQAEKKRLRKEAKRKKKEAKRKRAEKKRKLAMEKARFAKLKWHIVNPHGRAKSRKDPYGSQNFARIQDTSGFRFELRRDRLSRRNAVRSIVWAELAFPEGLVEQLDTTADVTFSVDGGKVWNVKDFRKRLKDTKERSVQIRDNGFKFLLWGRTSSSPFEGALRQILDGKVITFSYTIKGGVATKVAFKMASLKKVILDAISVFPEIKPKELAARNRKRRERALMVSDYIPCMDFSQMPLHGRSQGLMAAKKELEILSNLIGSFQIFGNYVVDIHVTKDDAGKLFLQASVGRFQSTTCFAGIQIARQRLSSAISIQSAKPLIMCLKFNIGKEVMYPPKSWGKPFSEFQICGVGREDVTLEVENRRFKGEQVKMKYGEYQILWDQDKTAAYRLPATKISGSGVFKGDQLDQHKIRQMTRFRHFIKRRTADKAG